MPKVIHTEKSVKEEAKTWAQGLTIWKIVLAILTLFLGTLFTDAWDAFPMTGRMTFGLVVSILVFIITLITNVYRLKKGHKSKLLIFFTVLSFLAIILFSISTHYAKLADEDAKNLSQVIEQVTDTTGTVSIPFEEIIVEYGEESPTTPVTADIDISELIAENITVLTDNGEEFAAKKTREGNTLKLAQLDAGSYTLHLQFQGYEELETSFSVKETEKKTLPNLNLKSAEYINNFSIYLKRTNGQSIEGAVSGLSVRNAKNSTYAQALSSITSDSSGRLPVCLSCKKGVIFDLSWNYAGKSGKEVIKTKNEDGNIEVELPINDETEIEFFYDSIMDFELMNGSDDGISLQNHTWDKARNYGLNNLNYSGGRLLEINLWRCPENKNWQHIDTRLTCTIPEHKGVWDFNGILIASKELENSPTHAKVTIRFNNEVVAQTEIGKETTDEFHFNIHAEPGDADRFFIEISADVAYEKPFFMGFVLPHENQATVEDSEELDSDTTV